MYVDKKIKHLVKESCSVFNGVCMCPIIQTKTFFAKCPIISINRQEKCDFYHFKTFFLPKLFWNDKNNFFNVC